MGAPARRTRQSHDRERPPAWGALRVADGDHTVTFRACRDRETHWIGGFVVAGARCVPLDIIVDGRTTRRELAFGVPRDTCPPPAVSFPTDDGWHVRVSGRGKEAPCLLDRVSWASTVALRDGAFSLPPQRTLATLPPDGIVIALYQFDNACLPSRPRTLPERSLGLVEQLGDRPHHAGGGLKFLVAVTGEPLAPEAVHRGVLACDLLMPALGQRDVHLAAVGLAAG